MNSIPSAAGWISRLVCARIRQADIQLEPLLLKAGLTVEQIDRRNTRLKVQSQMRILNLAADALQDGFLGFGLARNFDLREIGLLYYVMASSEVLSDALYKAARYSWIVNEGISLRVRPAHETAIALSYVNVERRLDRHQVEFWLTSLIRICRQLTSRRLMPSRISVIHRRRKIPAELRSFLGCEIEFGSIVDEVVFPENVRHLQIVSADAHLNELLVGYCDEAFFHGGTKPSTLRWSIENVVTPLLPHGKAGATEVARRLGMSHRTLARRLSSEGVTFSEIMEELKADLAKSYLNEEDLPISQIARLLGYSEVSAFTRAFTHWTGITPSRLRKGYVLSRSARSRSGPGVTN